MWLIPFGLLAYHTSSFLGGGENPDFNFEGAHRGGTPVTRRTEVAEERKRTKDPHRHKGLESHKNFLSFLFLFALSLFPLFIYFFVL